MSSEPDRLNQTSPPALSAGGVGSRYELLEKVASGGMATVYVGKLRGAEGFWRLVAIKRPHQHLLEDASFRRMFVEEARLASRIHHPHVVPVLDVEERSAGQLLLVMDYVEGASLAELMEACASRGGAMPARVAVRIALDALAGLHAAHELTDAAGRQLRLVHRDVSPHNILVGVDGTSRVADFGIAKSIVSKGVTESGVLKGKLAYMAPEYIERQECDARGDVFSMAIVTWEAIAGRRLFKGESDYDTLRKIVDVSSPPLSSAAPWVGTALDAVLSAALDRDLQRRTRTARAFGDALEAAARKVDLVATTSEVGDFLRDAVAERLATRRERLRRFLDAGGTTGPMDAALAAVAQSTPIRMESAASAAPSASGVSSSAVTIPTPAPRQAAQVELTPAPIGSEPTPPPSQAVTSLGVDGTERALVAAGLRPRKRGGSGLFIATGAAVVIAGVIGFAILQGGFRLERDAASASASPASAPAPSASTASSSPTVSPVDVAPATPPSASASSSAGPTPPSTQPSSPNGPRPRPTGATQVPTPPPVPPTEPAGPIRKNPYR